MIQLISGNPWGEDGLELGKPASFSRFILPFSYTLDLNWELNDPREKNELFFATIQTEKFSRERKKYFTSETAEVLYGRALWAQIPKEIWNKSRKRCGSFSFLAPKSQQTLELIVAQPWVVLFEGQKHHGDHTLLQNGFLILETYLAPGTETTSLDDFLAFNDLFRFFDQPYPAHAKDFATALNDFPADYVSGKKIASYKRRDYFSGYKQRWLSLLRLPLLKGGYWYSMIPESILDNEEKNSDDSNLSCTRNNCLNYADNRTFVWTCAIVDNGAKELCTKFWFDVEEPWKSGHWLRLLNVDPPEKIPKDSHSSINTFQQEWLKERTYLRWTEDGTYYGYSYHSGAMLTSPSTIPPLWYHFGQMYFDQILLLFYLRITLFSFSQDLTQLNNSNNQKLLKNGFKKVRCSFAKFTNLYQFPLISNQQQGVEMYAIARKHMDIDGLFNDMKDEVTSTHEFLEMEVSTSLEKMAFWIAGIGLILAILAVPWDEIIKAFKRILSL